MPYVLHLWFSDRSGILQTFGPYESESEATEARDALMRWRGLNGAYILENWSVGTVEKDPTAKDDDQWTPQLATEFRTRFNNGEACKHCGGIHARACPRVKRMTFHPNGSLAEIEFWEAGVWPEDNVAWPEEIPYYPDTEETV